LGQRSGNWLTLAQSSDVLNHAGGDSLRAKRDHAMLAILLGCGLRRSELVDLEIDEVQIRQEHWAIVDLIGKGGRIRTVPIPQWAKQALDVRLSAAAITRGRKKALSRALILARFRAVREPPSNTILFIPLSGNYCNPDFDWAMAGGEKIIRFCPKCLCDTIIGHGRQRKQAHDESHDWIETRRGAARNAKQPSLSFPFSPYPTPTTV
jgi:hypothetical protein